MAVPQFVLYARVGEAWCKGKVKGHCSVTVGEQKSVYEVPGSLPTATPFFGIDLSHIYGTSFGREWRRFGCEKSSAGIADWYFFPLPCS
jgi:hypothetical protein